MEERKMEMNDDLITLIDEQGLEHDFFVNAFLDVDGVRYAILISAETAEDQEAPAAIFRFGKDADGAETLTDVEDEAEWERVSAAYEALPDSYFEDEEE